MGKISMVYWKEKDYFIGYIQEYPNFRTQGLTMDELKENLLDIYKDILDDKVGDVQKAEIMDLIL